MVSLCVTGGFLGGIRLEFADGRNCFIGGRGAGKTTALEFVRFGLGLMPDPKTSPQRHRTIDSLVKANLGAGRLSVELRTKTGMRYTAGRAANESVQVLNEAGTAVPRPLARLYHAFHNARLRAHWLPDVDLTVRTAVREKSMRITWPDQTSVEVGFMRKAPGKSQVALTHSKLPGRDSAVRMQQYWAERLSALGNVLAPD